jgi:probable F420-dependent oxidoreductase
MQLGKLGVWTSMEGLTAADAADFAKRVEQWGYSALWMPEGVGRNALVFASWLLGNTSRLVIATGIAQIHARDPQAMASAQSALNEQSGNRFLLGMGVSHVPVVEGVRGHTYGKPVATMRGYLEAMSRATYIAPRPSQKPVSLIAALGPQMLKLAAESVDGAHCFLVTPEHTAEARAILGAGKLLCPEQKVLLETDPSRARDIARPFVARYIGLANYRNNLLRLGFTATDFDGGGSDRLIDALVAWGDEAAIRRRIQAHWDAGADQVCIQAINRSGDTMGAPDEHLLKLLAPGA